MVDRSGGATGTIDAQNNIIGRGGQALSIDSQVSSVTFKSNYYANIGGSGNSNFQWDGHASTNTFSGWQSACSCDASPSEANTPITSDWSNFNTSTGATQAGFPGNGKGQNLTNLASGSLAALALDINGNARPSSGNWDAGAINSGSAGTSGVGLSTTSFAFGNEVVGNSSATQTVTLTNTGTATLNISSITFTGTNTGDFSKTTTCGATVAAQGTCTVTVTFTPTATGARSASLSFADDAPNTPQIVTLTGSGTSISLVHFTACASQTWTGSCAITSTTAGNSLVVGFTSNNGQGTALITAVTDNANDGCTQVPGARSTNTTPNSSADIWTCFGVKGGATSITVTTNASATGELGVWEVANVKSVDAKCTGNSQASSSTPTGCSLTTTVPSEFLVELADYQGSITGINAGNAFLSDSTQQGNGYAHRVVSSTGAYSAQWASSAAGTFNSSGVSVH